MCSSFQIDHEACHFFAEYVPKFAFDEGIGDFDDLLGHKRLDTMAHYTRVATDLISKVVSPLDQLTKKGKKDEPPK